MSFTIKRPKRRTNEKRVLLDADILVYRVGFAAQVGYGEDAVPEPVANALHSCKLQIERILDRFDTGLYKLYLTGSGNFREDVAVSFPYKGNRTSSKPIHYQALRDYMVDVWDAEIVDGMEADDALGIAASTEYFNLSGSPEDCKEVVCTIDKDLLMIPGWNYNFVKDELQFITHEEGIRFFYQQLIMGDSTDNIVGIPRYGPVRSAKYLEDLETEWDMYQSVLELYEGNEERLLENARLLWILREAERHWNPPTAPT